MGEREEIRSELIEALQKTARSLKLVNFEINFDSEALQAEGFIGEFFLGTITDNNTKKVHHMAIKKAYKNPQRRKAYTVEMAFQNEHYFYSTILPALEKFQSDQGHPGLFNEVPRFFHGSSEPPKEVVVLENLKVQGYDIRDRNLLIDDEHCRFIFATYGRFHGVGMAFRDQHREEFDRLVSGNVDLWKTINKENQFEMAIKKTVKEIYELLDSEKIRTELKPYCSLPVIFDKVITNSSPHITVTHGDCWTNNMMFKYHSGKLVSMKLIDFQLSKAFNPVFDLSYFFYTAGSKKLFEKLDDYLKVYHDSLSSTITSLGSDPSKLYTYEQVKSDWKTFAKFGAITSLLLTKVKLIDRSDMDDIMSKNDFENDEEGGFSTLKVDQKLFKERVTDILEHACEYGALKLN